MFTAIVDVIYLNSAGLAFVDVTDISCFIYSDILTDWPGVKNGETGQMEFCVMGKNDQAVYWAKEWPHHLGIYLTGMIVVLQ